MNQMNRVRDTSSMLMSSKLSSQKYESQVLMNLQNMVME